MTENLQCIIASLRPVTAMNINKTSEQFLALEGLQESTTYQYCLLAYNNATNELIGFPICGGFKTTGREAVSILHSVPIKIVNL